MRPICIDLFCGLGGWTDGFLAEGWDCFGFDLERHDYGSGGYPGDLVLQDILTLHGLQFKDAAVIVASPPCQEFSYMAMPWSRGKQIAAALRGKGEFPEGYAGSRTIPQLTALFDACFRIQREVCEASGRYIPLIIENVRGAIPWVGPAAWNYGSFYLWGDVPALMPFTGRSAMKQGIAHRSNGETSFHGLKLPGKVRSWSDFGQQRLCDAVKHGGDCFSDPAWPGRQGGTVKQGRKGAGAGAAWFDSNLCVMSSRSDSRKAASAQIAKIPFALARHIAEVFKP